jgi:RNA polymerase sigma factor (sigma-70 family)
MPKPEPVQQEQAVGELVALFARIRAGDEEAWNSLTDRYNGLLWSVARSFQLSAADAADVVQATWLRLVEALDSVRQPERIGSWLATTARREALAVLRRGTRERPSAIGDVADSVDSTDEVDEALLRRERNAWLWRAFEQLKPACQVLLRLLISEPRPSYAEAAAVLGLPVGSIGPTRQRCIALLRRILVAGVAPASTSDPPAMPPR